MSGNCAIYQADEFVVIHCWVCEIGFGHSEKPHNQLTTTQKGIFWWRKKGFGMFCSCAWGARRGYPFIILGLGIWLLCHFFVCLVRWVAYQWRATLDLDPRKSAATSVVDHFVVDGYVSTTTHTSWRAGMRTVRWNVLACPHPSSLIIYKKLW